MSRPASSRGRTHRTYVTIRAHMMANDPDICCWCAHPGTNAINHNYPVSRFPELAHSREHMARIHGREGCPYCRSRTGKARNCNAEIGDRILGVEVFPPAAPSRSW